ncbi:MAG: hypothetical protein JXQ66_01185 [Campylobacterales bacterium]|nr:hypothetical protein [Campylobacterales bacterium]
MYAVEFEAIIEDGVVHIPKKYHDLQHSQKATFVVMYEKSNNESYEDTKYMIESSVNTIKEWQDESEDDIWK